MSFVTDTLTPVIKGTVIVGIIVWFGYIAYWMINKSGGNVGLWIKYKVLRRKYDERIVAWCLQANELDMTEGDVRKKLNLHGMSPDSVEETAYIYKKIRKMKGGLIKDEQRIRESNLQTLPEVKGKG